MKTVRIYSRGTLIVLATMVTIAGLHQRVAAQPKAPADQTRIEILTRGPLHEAFAETISFDPQPGVVAPMAPPEPIEEVTPNQRPEGSNVAWIPGYWAWDDERNDFLWVSGIWRSLPPGRQWVPGYWGQSEAGAQWTSGYWADSAASEADYLPEPPATLEDGPNVAAPSPDSIWLPGSWIWQQNRFAWRAGFWTQGHQGWDWVPDHYVWTPSGYIFVDGYYDYSVPRRGIVFAPVYFQGGLRTQRNFSYSPSTVINVSVLARHLFLRPSYGHYYFGDYYGSNYANAGFSPWYSYQSSRRGYDPIYANQRWQHRAENDWEQRAEANYLRLRDNEKARPPHNWSAQQARAERADSSDRTEIAVAAQLDELIRSKDSRLQFQQVDPAERQQFGQRQQAYRNYLQQRQLLESNAAPTPGGIPTAAAGPSRRQFSRSPYVAQSAAQLGENNRPPQPHQVLKPDLQVQPPTRLRGGSPGTLPSSRPGRTGAARAEQTQIDSQAQQRQRVNQGNRQGAANGQSQRQGASRGNNRQGAQKKQQENSSQQQGSSQNQSKNKPKP